MEELTTNVAGEINNLHNEILGFPQKTLNNAIRIGELLTKKKEELVHGEFLPWLKQNVNFSPDVAERYRRIFERKDELSHGQVHTITSALKLLKKSNDLMTGKEPVKRIPKKSPEEQQLEDEAAQAEKEQLLKSIGIEKTPEEKQAEETESFDTERDKLLEGILNLLETCLTWKSTDCLEFLKELAGRIDDEIQKLEPAPVKRPVGRPKKVIAVETEVVAVDSAPTGWILPSVSGEESKPSTAAGLLARLQAAKKE